MGSKRADHPSVVIASRIFTPEPAAASFRLKALADAFNEFGGDVLVLTSKVDKKLLFNEESGSLRVKRAPVLRDRSGSVRGYLQYLSFDVPLFFRLLLNSSRLVIVEPPPTSAVSALLSSWLRPKKIVYFAADIWSDASESTGAPRIVIRMLRRLESFVMRHAALVLAVSDEIAGRVNDLDGRRVEVVGNGVDTGVFTWEGDKTDPGHPYLIYAGTVSEWQGAETLLLAFGEVLKTYGDVNLYFFAQGTSLPNLESLAKQLPEGRVHFRPLVPPEEIARWTRNASASLVSIQPGLGYDFAIPTKLFASLACGTPVVFAGVGPLTKMIEDNQLGWSSGWSVDEIANAIKNALSTRKSEAQSRRLSEWVEANHSLRAVAARAVQAVMKIALR
ncbi:MAG: glycosyltransferase family 4 protein [Cryobacterium sp.]|nr:glycosyltransferase family 4 protein [Cryobacterium sp.]